MKPTARQDKLLVNMPCPLLASVLAKQTKCQVSDGLCTVTQCQPSVPRSSVIVHFVEGPLTSTTALIVPSYAPVLPREMHSAQQQTNRR